MRVLFVIPTLKEGGAERAMSNITTHLPDDVDADILINSISDHDFPTHARIISLNMPQSENMGLLYQFIAMIKRILRLYTLKRKNNYDTCVSFIDSANIANILTGKRKCRVIVSVRCSLQEQSNVFQYKYIVSPLVRLLYNKADKIVAVSERLKRELIAIFRIQEDKITTIENGFDVSDLWQKAVESLDLEDTALEDTKYIVTAGRLVNEKGHWHLIRAFARVVKDLDAQLLILGSGPLESYLRNVTEACGIKDRVLFKGFVTNPYKYIRRADGFVMPSLTEGFPNALAEAVCLGVPCIAADFNTGSREILAPELLGDKRKICDVSLTQYGIMTPLCSGVKYKGDEDLEQSEIELAKAIVMLLKDTELREEYAKKCVERSEELKIQHIVQKWIQVASVDEC